MDWLKLEIATGLQKLTCLGLEGQPASELIEGTLAAWVEVVTAGRTYDEAIDAPRFRIAFTRLMGRNRWPAPCHLLEAMPKRPEPLAIAHEIKADPAKVEECARQIASVLSRCAQA